MNNKVFNDNDYNSNNGMMPYIWGPALWHFLHTISFNYPIHPTLKDKKYYYKFIKYLQYILPCKECRDNLKSNFKTLPLKPEVFKNRYNFSKYIFKLHELINLQLNKKNDITYDKVKNIYENFRSRCIKCNETNTNTCDKPIYKGIKSKCILNIIPKNNKISTFNIDKKCFLEKI